MLGIQAPASEPAVESQPEAVTEEPIEEPKESQPEAAYEAPSAVSSSFGFMNTSPVAAETTEADPEEVAK